MEVNEGVPVLQGTTAALEGVGFTGVSQISLDGAVKDAPPITDKGPAGRPVIPTRRGGLGQLLNTAPQLLKRLSAIGARLGALAARECVVAGERRLGRGDAGGGRVIKKKTMKEQE